jgi:SHS2 domain-containing protein
MNDETAGYREIEHTADWALHVWAPDLPGLFTQAARGMYALANTCLDLRQRHTCSLELTAWDAESLLVAFLNRLLYIGEDDGLAFDQFDLQVEEQALHAGLSGGSIRSQDKVIKAVTFHDLAIQRAGGRLQVKIVFDV